MADRGMDPSALVSVEPPYDHLFIMARRQLAPSAIFTYDRKWIMTAKQLEDILDCMRRYVAAAEDEVRKARAIVDAGGEFDRRDLRSMEQNLDSMSRVIPWLEQPEPWGPPGEEADERMRRETEGEREETA